MTYIGIVCIGMPDPARLVGIRRSMDGSAFVRGDVDANVENEVNLSIYRSTPSTGYWSMLYHQVPGTYTWRFQNFSFYPSIAPTGLVRAEDSLKTETRFKEESTRKTVRKKKKIGERKKSKKQIGED